MTIAGADTSTSTASSRRPKAIRDPLTVQSSGTARPSLALRPFQTPPPSPCDASPFRASLEERTNPSPAKKSAPVYPHPANLMHTCLISRTGTPVRTGDRRREAMSGSAMRRWHGSGGRRPRPGPRWQSALGGSAQMHGPWPIQALARPIASQVKASDGRPQGCT